MSTNEDRLVSIYLLIFILVLVVSLFVANQLEAYKYKFIPEVGAIAIVGMVIKGLIMCSLYITKHSFEGFDVNQLGLLVLHFTILILYTTTTIIIINTIKIIIIISRNFSSWGFYHR